MIYLLVIDDINSDKFWDHGLTADQVLQVLENPYSIVRNRKNRRASHMLVGRDHNGLCIAIPIEPTHDYDVWRPVTAWPCKDSERSWLPRRT